MDAEFYTVATQLETVRVQKLVSHGYIIKQYSSCTVKQDS